MKFIFIILALFFTSPLAAQIVSVKHGGTGASSKDSALKNLLPTQHVADSLKALSTDGHGNVSWQSVSGGGGVTVPLTLRMDTVLYNPDWNFALKLINTSINDGVSASNSLSPNLQWSSHYFNAGDTGQSLSEYSMNTESIHNRSISAFYLDHRIDGQYVSDFNFGDDSVASSAYISFNTNNTDFKLQSLGGGNSDFWLTAPANCSLHLTVPASHGTAGQVLTDDGTGVTSWGAAGSPWFVGQATNPVSAPSVTDGSKGIGAGDSVTISAYGGIAVGRRTAASAIDAIAIGSKSVASGNFSLAIGNSDNPALAKSIGTIAIQATDAATSQTDDGQHGYNILIGALAANTATSDALNIALGYNAQVRGAGNTLVGSNAYANGGSASYETFYGYAAGNFVPADGKYQTIIGAYGSLATPEVTGLPHLNHDSTTVLGSSYGLYSRNAHHVLVGYNNDTTQFTFSNAKKGLFTVGAGNLYLNAARFNALNVTIDGTVAAGNNFVASTSLGIAATPIAGTYAKDNAIIAWGNIAADGTITSQYGNFTIAHTGSSGIYTITLPTSITNPVVTVTPQTLALFSATISGATLTVNTDLGTIALPVATDEAFYFVVTGRP